MELFFLSVYQTFDEQQHVFTDLGLKPVLHIDKYREQPLNPQMFEYYDLPALFIDWQIKWERANKKYVGMLNLDFHVQTDATWDTSNISTNREAGLESVLYLSLVRSVLDQLRSPHTGPLTRSDDTPVDTGVTNYHILKYTAPYYDPGSTDPGYIEVLIEQLKLSGYLKRAL